MSDVSFTMIIFSLQSETRKGPDPSDLQASEAQSSDDGSPGPGPVSCVDVPSVQQSHSLDTVPNLHPICRVPEKPSPTHHACHHLLDITLVHTVAMVTHSCHGYKS